ncbi:MAG: hypothetical protein GY754_42035 [bacterium]|nr:hypothetical protein [bacterium]
MRYMVWPHTNAFMVTLRNRCWFGLTGIIPEMMGRVNRVVLEAGFYVF